MRFVSCLSFRRRLAAFALWISTRGPVAVAPIPMHAEAESEELEPFRHGRHFRLLRRQLETHGPVKVFRQRRFSLR